MIRTAELWPLLKQTGSDWLEDKASRLAAALAYYSVFSLAPLLVLAVIGLSTFMDKAQAKQKIEGQMQQLMGSAGKEAVTQMLTKADEQGGGGLATVVSVVILFFAASGVFGELQDAMNTIWEVKPKPAGGVGGWLRARFFSMAMVLGVGFLLLVSLIISTVLTAAANRMFGDFKVIGFVVNLIASLIVVNLLFAAIFKFLPDVRISWGDVWLGAGLTAVLFELGKWGLTLYLRWGSTASAFGTAGSLAALLIWVYYSAQILFFGAEFTQVYANAYSSRIVPTADAEPATNEERAQQGLGPRKGATAAARPEYGSVVSPRGPRQIVTIERPAPAAAKSYAIAGGGVLAGAALAVAGVFARRFADRVERVRLNERIDAVERRIRSGGRTVERFGRELDLAERLNAINEHVRDVTRRYRRQTYRGPRWVAAVTEKLGGY